MNKKEKKHTVTNRAVFGWLSNVTGRRKWQVAALLLLQSALGASSVGYAMLLRNMIDSAVDKNEQKFISGAFLLVGLILFQLICRAFERFLEEDARSTLENRLKKRLFAVLLNKDYASVTAVHSGEWMNRLTSDTVVVADGLVQILPGTAGMLIKMISALVMILVLEPRFGLILIPGGFFMVVTSYGFRKHMKTLHKGIQENDGRLRVFLQEHLGSLLIVRSFAMEKQILKDAEERMKLHKKARMKRNHFSNLCNISFSGLMQGVYVFGAIFCSYGIMSGMVTYGTLTAILQLITQVQAPVANITGYLPKYYAMLASAERLMEAEMLQNDDVCKVYSIAEVHEFYERDFSTLGLENVAFTHLPLIQEVDLVHADLSKAHMPMVFENVNFEIKKGDYVAFTGHSGSGKSTLLKLMMCLYPLDKGSRYLKDINGNRKELNGSWQKLFAYVPQGNHLMNGSIREIIAFADKSRMNDEKDLREAMKIACADEFIDSLEHGLDTVLGERGQGLSEGQMQRIAIARAVFSNNPIMILDEATSALDDSTEKRLLENLRTMTDKTVLIVTHRPAALNICNKQVIFSSDGIRLIKRRLQDD